MRKISRKYKTEVESIKMDIQSFLVGWSMTHHLVSDYTSFISGSFGNGNLDSYWVEKVIACLSDSGHEKFSKRINQLAISSWLKYGETKYGVTKRIFIDTINSTLSEDQITKLTDLISHLVKQLSIQKLKGLVEPKNVIVPLNLRPSKVILEECQIIEDKLSEMQKHFYQLKQLDC